MNLKRENLIILEFATADGKGHSEDMVKEIELGSKMDVELENVHEAGDYLIGQGTYTVTNGRGAITDDSK